MSTAAEFRNVSKRFGKKKNALWALRDVSFSIAPGTTLGVVGESGSGKSTLARIAVGLEHPTSGEVSVNGMSLNESRRERASQMVFQDPASSLNPHMTLLDSVREPLDAHHERTATSERNETARGYLREVGMSQDFDRRYPIALSGGQKQRSSIGRALTTLPPLVVCDEPVTALDVSIRAQLLNLLRRLQAAHGLSFMYISHDLTTVTYMSDQVLVLYLGAVMEIADVAALVAAPAHPYTHALMGAVPRMQQGVQQRPSIRLLGDPPSPMNPPSGCSFSTRCPVAEPRCFEETPPLRELDDGHQVACHLAPVSVELMRASQQRIYDEADA
ncbi:MAG: oligopeptide/dipeptide ABC transporter ATP-binding protein [Ilumatobacter sp.]|uniref:oligopeptide/dipeptide ABC transporter ATP-binding protein n=1 Tax=Ilumatobacter sp. TaxID=1967498 RepID=UPI00391D8F06